MCLEIKITALTKCSTFSNLSLIPCPHTVVVFSFSPFLRLWLNIFPSHPSKRLDIFHPICVISHRLYTPLICILSYATHTISCILNTDETTYNSVIKLIKVYQQFWEQLYCAPPHNSGPTTLTTPSIHYTYLTSALIHHLHSLTWSSECCWPLVSQTSLQCVLTRLSGEPLYMTLNPMPCPQHEPLCANVISCLECITRVPLKRSHLYTCLV